MTATAVLYGLATFGAFLLALYAVIAAAFGIAWAYEAWRGRRSRRLQEQERALHVRAAERYARRMPSGVEEDRR